MDYARTYNVNVIGLEVLQALLNTRMHGLGTSPAIVAFLDRLAGHGAHAVLGGEDHLSAAARLFDPFANLLLALAGLVSIGGINEVSAKLVEGIEKSECRLLGALAHQASPGVTESCDI